MQQQTHTTVEYISPADTMAQAGQLANATAQAQTFARYQAQRPASTLLAQRGDLARFAAYLESVGVLAGDLAGDPDAWAGMTWGLVAGFLDWQLQQGYAVASINRALSTVRRYAALCGGRIDPNELHQIRAVRGVAHRDARHIDAQRETTRRGSKKAQPTPITSDQAAALKAQPDTPQGRRDRLLLCLLLDHGLRESEVADLQASDLHVKRGVMTFYRRKVDKTQTHKLSADTRDAAAAYLQHDAPALGALLRGSRKSGQLAGHMSTSAIRQRVRALGAAVGIEGLSPHDCRHYWATMAAERGINPLRLQEAGGWHSLEMPRRYVAAADIANEGMV
jgi:integrase